MSTRSERIAAIKRDYFEGVTNDDPRKRTRTVPMQVLNLSFPRTGSMSMQAALNQLGYSAYHSVSFFTSIHDTDMWVEACEAKFFNKGNKFTRQDWDQLLANFSAVSGDIPAICFAEDLLAAYPTAKVILIERDIDAWYASYDAAVISSIHSPFINLVCDWDRGFLGKIRGVHRAWTRGWMGAADAVGHRANAKQKYREHYDLVRKITPPERLLEYRLEQGWAPLCEFLGKEVPEGQFPRVNDSEAVWDLIGVAVWKGVGNLGWRLVTYAVPVVGAGVGWYLYKRT